MPNFPVYGNGLELGIANNSRFITSKLNEEPINIVVKRPGILFGATLSAPKADGFQIKLAIPSLPQLDLG